MITLVVLLYIVIGVCAVPRIARALGNELLRDHPSLPLDVVDQFMCFFFGLVLACFWPLPALFSFVRHIIFTEENQ